MPWSKGQPPPLLPQAPPGFPQGFHTNTRPGTALMTPNVFTQASQIKSRLSTLVVAPVVTAELTEQLSVRLNEEMQKHSNGI